MREILDFCVGGVRRNVPAGTLVLHEGGRTGHLFVLIEGRLEVVKSDTVVANVTEQGAVFGEMSVLLDKPHTATVRAATDSIVYEINDAASFLRQQPAVALLIARLLAQRLNVRHHLSCRHHASICRPRRPSLDGRRDPAEHDQPAADTGLARLGSAIRPKDVSQAGTSVIAAAGRCSGALRSMYCSSPIGSQNAVALSISSTMYTGGRPGCRPPLKTQVSPTRSNHDPLGMNGD